MIGEFGNVSANCEGLPLGWNHDVQAMYDPGMNRSL
jgi:hypothetical protein